MSQKQHSLLIASVILAVAIVGGTLLFSGGGEEETAGSATQPSSAGTVVKYSAVITNRSYNPAQIDVPLGTTVELTVTNNDNENHGLTISEFGVNGFVGPGQTKTVRFVADKVGQTATFCSAAHPEKLIINVTQS